MCADEETVVHAATGEDETDTLASSSPPPLLYSPQTLVQYLQNTYDLKTLKSTANHQNSPKSSNTLRFTVVMGHV